ncbi:MAG: hypothetical protein COT84_03745 [Chlamydiae bacterium CG10_big_fil_rev_8_21_14_0_10_35_9]|nr:MAG: hypothetical protein COT84_03745 [Chlamydiae bacterium CG10_big_fil_rev_8_21_14_0_10_35_9]
MLKFISIDIGGTKISISIGNEKGKIVNSDRMQTQSFRDSKEAIQHIIEKTKRLLKDSNKTLQDIDAVGISCPGPIHKTKGIMLSPPNLKGWKNTPIVKELEKGFSKPTFMNNDANAAVLAEFTFGTFKNTPNLVYLTASTGMGGGIIVNNQLLQGASDTAGEVGHFVLDPNGPLCPCGQRGCFEVYCGGANLAQKIRKDIQSENISTKIIDFASGDPNNIDITCLAKAVQEKDHYALQVWDTFTERMSQGIGMIIMTLNPEVIILGTIAIHTKDLLLNPLKEKLKKYAWPMALSSCIIQPSDIGDKISELAGLAVALNGLKGG